MQKYLKNPNKFIKKEKPVEMMKNTFEKLEKTIAERLLKPSKNSYVAQLNTKGVDAILKKIGEEATEVVIAAKGENKHEIVYESCDLLFHLMVLFANKGISTKDIQLEMERRMNTSGISEKASRTQDN